MTIDKIKREAQAGSIQDIHTAAKIIGELMDLKIMDLMNKMRYQLFLVSDLLEEYEDLEPCNKEILNYTDVLCMIGRTQWEAYEGESRTSSVKSVRYLFIKNIYQLFMETKEADLRVKLFYRLNLKTYFSALERVHQNHSVMICYGRLADWLGIDQESMAKLTVEDTVKIAWQMIGGYWRPWDTMTEYRSKIMDGYYALEAIFLQAFQKGVPERFSFDKVYNKCRDYQRTMDRS